MTTDIQKLPKSQVRIKGSLTVEDFEPFIKKATNHLVAEAELPGFRKGKAPANLVVERVGEGKILEEAAELALHEHYPKIITEHKLDAIGRPQIKITKLARGNAFEWEAELYVLPEITLPDYRNIAHTKNAEPHDEILIEEAEIDKALSWLQNSRKKMDGDVEILPEINDEFAKSVGKFENLEALKEVIRANLSHEKEDKAHDKRRVDLMEAVVAGTKMEVPEILIEGEKDKMLAELQSSVSSMGLSWEDYLAHAKKTESEIKDGFIEDAEKRARYGLALREIANRENLKPSDEEIATWADEYIKAQDEDTRKLLDRERVKDYAYGILRNNKVFAFLNSL